MANALKYRPPPSPPIPTNQYQSSIPIATPSNRSFTGHPTPLLESLSLLELIGLADFVYILALTSEPCSAHENLHMHTWKTKMYWFFHLYAVNVYVKTIICLNMPKLTQITVAVRLFVLKNPFIHRFGLLDAFSMLYYYRSVSVCTMFFPKEGRAEPIPGSYHWVFCRWCIFF